ncbi:MAG: hypothetical protein DCF26_10965 [Burkholderiales bacterium]|nr:MAG: hypothetical protein DCF26_10965 [Burkholderiales bacterium]
MYIWLSPVTINGAQTLAHHICELNVDTQPEADAGVLKERRNAVMALMQKAHPELVGADRNLLYAALSALVSRLPPGYGDLDFAIHLGMAHFFLPPAKRAERERVVDKTIEAYFGPPASRRADLLPRLDVLRTQILLLPDVLGDSLNRSKCGLLLFDTIMAPGSASCDPLAAKNYSSMQAVIAQLPVSATDKQSLLDMLCMMYCLVPIAARQGVINLVLDPRSRQALPILLPTSRIMIGAAYSFTPWQIFSGLFSVLSKATLEGVASTDPMAATLIDERVLFLNMQSDRMLALARSETIGALQAGVPMGVRGTSTRAALLSQRQALRRLDVRLAPKRPVDTQAPTPMVNPTTAPTDVEPAHAWSVARLVRWIEGPLTERSTTGRLNRQGVVAREKKAIEQDTQDQQGAGLPPEPVSPAITEDDVGLVINEALSATARFFHADIEDLAPLAVSLSAAKDLLGHCLELKEPLRALSDKPAAFDEEKARVLLQDAEGCIGSLRKSIKTAQASAQQVKRFGEQLGLALNAETLVLGKRHGGAIACPLRTDDWAWVAQTYHRRWLPRLKYLKVDGELITLPFDQAAALYVTGSSQSGYAFDVSVHLWQRRAGCTGQPSELNEDYPPMNEAQWFDTYIPCAVLHVPRAT